MRFNKKPLDQRAKGIGRPLDDGACKRLGGCSKGKAPGARPVACVGIDVGCVGVEAGAGAMVGGFAVVADKRQDVGRNRAVAESAGDSFVVSGVAHGG